MTTSIGRVSRVAVGVMTAALGLVLWIADAPAASADDSGATQDIEAHNVTSYNACKGSAGAQFVITQIDNRSSAPAGITVSVDGEQTGTWVPLDMVSGKTAHYDFYFATVGDTLSDATAVIYSGWSGEFNLSDCLSEVIPPVTTSTVTAPPTTMTTTVPGKTVTVTTTEPQQTVTSTVTPPFTTTVTTLPQQTVTETSTPPDVTTTVGGESGETSTVTQTVTNPVTVTETATVTQTEPGRTITIGGENQTVTNQAVETVTSPVTRTVTRPVRSTVTRQIQVAGESSSIPSSSKTSPSPIQVLGESSSIGPAPSANAHTGQSWGILPYLLFIGGALLALTGLRVRHGRAH